MENGNNNNNNLSNLYANPQFLAGLAMMRGTPADQAFTEAILRTQQIQQAQMQQQQYQRQQYAQQMLPQIAQQLAGLSPQEAFGKLVETGLEPKEAAVIIKSLGFSNNAPEIKEDVVFNPQTGEAMRKQITDGKLSGFDIIGASNPTQTGIGQQSNMQNNQYIEGFEPPSLGYETPVEAKERRKAESEQLEKYRESLKLNNENKINIEAFKEAAENFETGPFAESKKKYANIEKSLLGTDVFGIKPEYGDIIEKSTTELILPYVERNKGAASDKDMELFMKAAPNLNRNKKGNKMIVSSLEAIQLRNSERYKASQAYKNKFGTLNGFEDKWDNYTNNNPIFQDDNQGLNIDKDKIKNWKSYILGERDSANQSQNSKESNNLSLLSTEELLAIARGK